MKARGLALAAGGFGLAGWMFENSFFGPRNSAVFGGLAVPWLPSYAAAGSLALLTAPAMRRSGLPWYWRGAAYAALASGAEWTGCHLERENLGACVDLPHALLWGILGLVVEKSTAATSTTMRRP